MSSDLRPGSSEDLGAIAQLLKTAFHAPEDAPFLHPKLLAWKYFDPLPGSPGPRSYVLLQNGRLVAHGCAWPVKLAFGGSLRSAICLLDWAAAPGSPGVGMHLVRKFASLADLLLSIGGSLSTQSIMPRIGFRRAAEQRVYARVLRPWRQFRRRPGSPSPRNLARLARNIGYARAPLSPANGWTARPAQCIESCALDAAASPDAVVSIHSAEFLRFMTRCPAAQIRTFELLRHGDPKGYLVLSQVHGQSRISELRIVSPDPTDWAGAVSAVVEIAAREPEACELIAYAMTPLFEAALQANGFQPRDRRSVFVQNPANSSDAAWDLTMLDDDAAFLNIPERPFAT